MEICTVHAHARTQSTARDADGPLSVCPPIRVDGAPRDAARARAVPLSSGDRAARFCFRASVSQETAYADRLILHFEAGLLPLENGATLRAFLSKKLNCDPMRISKKFAGARCLGKQIFLRRAPDAPLDEAQAAPRPRRPSRACCCASSRTSCARSRSAGPRAAAARGGQAQSSAAAAAAAPGR